MNVHVRVVTHTIPNAFGIALTAMVVLTVKQPVFVVNSLLQGQPGITVCTCNILNSFFFHHYIQAFILDLAGVHNRAAAEE
jgi:hypothetical protein